MLLTLAHRLCGSVEATGVPNPADSSADSSEAADAGVSPTPGGAKPASNGDDGCSVGSGPASGSSHVVALGLVLLAGLRRCRRRLSEPG
jgi:MYXO-CTERM domain-containing protein